MKQIIIILILLSTVVPGCVGPDGSEPVKYTDISVAKAKSFIDEGGYFLLDVRTQGEYDAGHIAGSVLIPLDELPGRLDEVPDDEPVLVYCRTGRRSAIAAQTLIDNGYTHVYNMVGGIVAWEQAGYLVEK